MQLDQPLGYSVCKIARAQVVNAQAIFESVTEPALYVGLPYGLRSCFKTKNIHQGGFLMHSKMSRFSASIIETIKSFWLMKEENNTVCCNHRLLTTGAIMKLSHYSDCSQFVLPASSFNTLAFIHSTEFLYPHAGC
jgi:hypothetical protein